MGLLRRSNHETKKSKEKGTADMGIPARTHLYKKFGLGTLAVIAFLFAPLAVQAMSDSGADEPALSSEQTAADTEQGGQVMTINHDVLGHSSAAEGVVGASPGNSSNSSVEVSIDGQAVAVPQNGSYHGAYSNNGSSTEVNITVDNNQAGNTHVQSHSSTIEINTTSGAGGQDRDNRDREREHDRDR